MLSEEWDRQFIGYPGSCISNWESVSESISTRWYLFQYKSLSQQESVVNNLDSRARLSEVKAQLCRLLTVWPWASYWTDLCLRTLICGIRLEIALHRVVVGIKQENKRLERWACFRMFALSFYNMLSTLCDGYVWDLISFPHSQLKEVLLFIWMYKAYSFH